MIVLLSLLLTSPSSFEYIYIRHPSTVQSYCPGPLEMFCQRYLFGLPAVRRLTLHFGSIRLCSLSLSPAPASCPEFSRFYNKIPKNSSPTAALEVGSTWSRQVNVLRVRGTTSGLALGLGRGDTKFKRKARYRICQ